MKYLKRNTDRSKQGKVGIIKHRGKKKLPQEKIQTGKLWNTLTSEQCKVLIEEGGRYFVSEKPQHKYNQVL